MTPLKIAALAALLSAGAAFASSSACDAPLPDSFQDRVPAPLVLCLEMAQAGKDYAVLHCVDDRGNAFTLIRSDKENA